MAALLDRLNKCGALLQIALDFTSLEDAVRVAVLSGMRGQLILEAGTPLIKAEGVKAVKVLRSLPGSHLVMADTKTMDTGALEAELMLRAGADAVSAMVASSEETIREAVRAAEQLGGVVYADMMGFTDLSLWVEKARRANAHVVLLHTGIDVQRSLGITASQALDLIRKAKELFKGPVAAAGGIKPEDVPKVVGAGADIVIIGSAITKSSDPAAATASALKGLGSEC